MTSCSTSKCLNRLATKVFLIYINEEFKFLIDNLKILAADPGPVLAVLDMGLLKVFLCRYFEFNRIFITCHRAHNRMTFIFRIP